MKFVRHVRNSQTKKKLRNVKTMKLQGTHDKQTESMQSVKFIYLENIHNRLEMLEELFKDQIKEYERMKLREEIADDLRF